MHNDLTQLPELLQHERFNQLVTTYPSLEAQAQEIAQRLIARYPERSPREILRALEVSLATIQRGTIQAFLSFKMTEQGRHAATTITEVLQALTAGGLEVASALDFPPGREWPSQIRRAVESANWFILMLPERSRDYDWMLFETGMFRAQMTLVDRLICVHHPLVPVADQIREFQSVPATEQSLRALLQKLAINKDAVLGMPPLNPAGTSLLDGLTKKIAESIIPPETELDRTYHGRLITLSVDGADRCDPDKLKSAKIEKCHAVERIFDRDVCPESFGALIEDAVDFDKPARWVEELCGAIRRAARGKTVKPIQSTVTGAEFGREFRPILHATDRRPGQKLGTIFHVMFMEDARVISAAGIPKSVGVLASLVRQSFRFQWEVLGRFNRPDLSEDDVEGLEDTLGSLEADFSASGFTPEDVEELIRTQFSSDHQRRIGEMHQLWLELRRPDRSGRLDRALRRRDVEEVQEILEGLPELANQYLAILTHQFHIVSKTTPLKESTQATGERSEIM